MFVVVASGVVPALTNEDDDVLVALFNVFVQKWFSLKISLLRLNTLALLGYMLGSAYGNARVRWVCTYSYSYKVD